MITTTENELIQLYSFLNLGKTIAEWLTSKGLDEHVNEDTVAEVKSRLDKMIKKLNLPPIISDITFIELPKEEVEEPEPSIISRGAALTSALAIEAASMLTSKRESLKVAKTRAAAKMEICKTNACGQYNSSKGTCNKCTCYLKYKTRLKTSSCPIGYW